MADNDKRKLDIPWATLLPLAAVLAGVVAQYKPLLSERPSVPSEKTAPVIAAQDRYSCNRTEQYRSPTNPSTLDKAATVEHASQLAPSPGQVRFDPLGVGLIIGT